MVDGQPIGGPCSRADKLKAALRLHFPMEPENSNCVDALSSRLLLHVQDTWSIDLGLQQRFAESASSQDLQLENAASKDTVAYISHTADSEQRHLSEQHEGRTEVSKFAAA